MPLEQEIATYERLRPSLLAEQEGEYALIHGDQVDSFWPSYAAAVEAGDIRFGLAPFLVQKVEANPQPVPLYDNIYRRALPDAPRDPSRGRG